MTRAKEMREMVLAIDAHTTGDITVTGNIEQNGTAAMKLPTGTTAQRHGTPTAGHIRFNTTTSSVEVYDGSSFTSVGGTALGGGSDQTFLETDNSVNSDYTLSTNRNAMTVGPVTINTNATVTVPSGQRWIIL
jgi:hypothetical protein